MNCRICGKRADIYLRAHNSAFCREHYREFFLKRVKKAIKTFNMFSEDEKILVAVSGGKDSLALLHALKRLNYKVSGFHIQLGIGDYSRRSLKKVMKFAEREDVEIKIERVEEVLGVGVPRLAEITGRPACSVCGIVKRYLMNRAASDFDVITTGHNLDDEAATLLGNLLSWNQGYINRQAPVLEKKGSLIKKVKPFVFLSEYEVAIYAFFEGIDYIVEECPFAKGAKSIFFKNKLNALEERMPGIKLKFLKGFYERKKLLEGDDSYKEPSLKPCVKCGHLTSVEICSFCRLKEKVEKIWR